MRRGRFSRLAVALGLGLVVALAGCGGDPSWGLKDISGLMPELQFTLTDDAGQVVRADDFRGKVTLLYFGYTHCPDVCPTTLATLTQARAKLGAQAAAVRILFVTVDPARDTVARLHRYVALFGSGVVGLRGEDTQLRALTKRYRVTYGLGQPDENGDYPVAHSSAVFVFDRTGEVRLLATQADGIEAIASDLERLLRSG